MIEIKKIFAVIDPSTDEQVAFQRAVRIAGVTGAKIHAYLCISPVLDNHDTEALRRVEMARYEPWLDSIANAEEAEGFDISSEIEWSSNWRYALGEAARRADCDYIVKSSHRRTVKKRLMMTSSDQALLKTASCPVQLVSTKVVEDLNRALIAIDAKRDNEAYQAIFNEVIAYGKTIAATHENGELHAVYAYADSEDYRYITDIAKRVDIDTSCVHEVGGSPAEAITEVANEVNAQIIVIGLSTKGTLANRVFGSMADRLLNNIELDILVVIPKGL